MTIQALSRIVPLKSADEFSSLATHFEILTRAGVNTAGVIKKNQKSKIEIVFDVGIVRMQLLAM